MILTKETELELPILPVRDTVVFPRMMVPLFVGRDKSLLALEAAIQAGSNLVVLTQRGNDTENPVEKDLYQIGTEASVGRLLRMPDGTANILISLCNLVVLDHCMVLDGSELTETLKVS